MRICAGNLGRCQRVTLAALLFVGSLAIGGQANATPAALPPAAASVVVPAQAEAKGPLAVTIVQSLDDAAHAKAREDLADVHDQADLDVQKQSALAAILSLVISAATMGLLILTLRETRLTTAAAINSATAAREAVDVAKLDLVHSNRAYVCVNGFAARAGYTPQNTIDEWKIDIEIKNVGSTPTKHLVADINYYFGPTELPNDFAFPRSDARGIEGPFVMAPGTLQILDGPKFGVLDMERVRRGTAHLYVYGWMEYNDIFQGTDRHRTEFCLKIVVINDPLTNEESRHPIWTVNYSEHNGMDGECMRQPTPYNVVTRAIV